MLANESSYCTVLLHVYNIMCSCSIAVHSGHVHYTMLLATILILFYNHPLNNFNNMLSVIIFRKDFLWL